MATIYLGRTSTELGGERLVVVKEILPAHAKSEEFCRLLIDEAKLSAQLSHKNIVQVTDLGREQDTLYITMEYIEGLDLRELLRLCSKNKVPLPIEFALFIVLETLHALDYAHRKKDEEGRPLSIVHRDVSPSNVLLSVEGEVKLCDFGIALAATTGDVLPEEAIQGKAGYMSPEAANGTVLDQRADVFSAGVILYELLSGHRLYRAGAGRPSVLEQARAADIAVLPSRGHPDEDRLREIVMKAVTRDVSKRYATARDFHRELEAYVAKNRLVASPLRFGAWLMDHFSAEMIERRREHERAAKRLDEQESEDSSLRVVPQKAELQPNPALETTEADPLRNASPEEVTQAEPRTPPPPRSETSKAASFVLIVVLALVCVLAALFALR